MTYIIDAQLPYLLATVLRQRGYDAIHTDDLPNRERTGDQEIRMLAIQENRIVITKDADFLDTYTIHKIPPRLLLLTTGNIKNRRLLDLFRSCIDAVDELFNTHSYIEIDNETYIIHE